VDERQAYVGDATMNNETARSMSTGLGRQASTMHIMRWLTASALLVALLPSPAHAQRGRLKKLKEKFGAPDSAARAKDSLAQIAAGVKPESVKVGKSFLQKSAAVVSSANGALESATGISAKDAALAASGIGASNLMAKKLGLDPMSIGQQAIASAKMSAQQRAMQQSAGKVGMPGAGVGGTDVAQMQAMQQGAMANAAVGARANSAAMTSAYANAGYSQDDIDALTTFQQEMMQLSMAASAGDASAKSRLEAWEALVLKYQAEMQKLSLAAGTGDIAAAQKAQRMQFDMIKEWNAGRSGHAKLPKAKRP
jgi:hypothetical protein